MDTTPPPSPALSQSSQQAATSRKRLFSEEDEHDKAVDLTCKEAAVDFEENDEEEGGEEDQEIVLSSSEDPTPRKKYSNSAFEDDIITNDSGTVSESNLSKEITIKIGINRFAKCQTDNNGRVVIQIGSIFNPDRFIPAIQLTPVEVKSIITCQLLSIGGTKPECCHELDTGEWEHHCGFKTYIRKFKPRFPERQVLLGEKIHEYVDWLDGIYFTIPNFLKFVNALLQFEIMFDEIRNAKPCSRDQHSSVDTYLSCGQCNAYPMSGKEAAYFARGMIWHDKDNE